MARGRGGSSGQPGLQWRRALRPPRSRRERRRVERCFAKLGEWRRREPCFASPRDRRRVDEAGLAPRKGAVACELARYATGRAAICERGRHGRRPRDVKKVCWELKKDSLGIVRMDFIGFKAVLRRRRRLFEKETFHIVEIIIDGTAVLQLLFRQSDGYLVAFRLVRNKKENSLAWEGWFIFKDRDLVLPPFIGETKLLNLNYGYEHAAEVTICRDTMSQIVACLLDFKPANCTKKSYGAYDRAIMLETWMVFLGECQRSGVFLDFVERHHESEIPQPVGQELVDHLHSWSNLSKAILHIYLADLMKLYGERSWEVKLEEAEDELTDIVSALTAFDFNLIKSYIVFHTNTDGTITDRPDALLSMPSLLGSEVGHLLHLIKCDDEKVQEIHKLKKKHREQWPDPGTDPDTEPEPDSEEPS